MLSFIYHLYFYRHSNLRIDLLSSRLFVRLLNLFLPIWFVLSSKFKHNRLKAVETDLFIVSLTTFPARINKVWLTIESILRQKEKPDKIILWLYKGEFNGIESLPKNLLRLQSRGLEIRFCEDNLMPHKKYYYSILEYPNSHIITIDDDMIYPPNLISKLKYYSIRYPETIICPITRHIKVVNNIIRPYSEWSSLNTNTNPSFSNLTMGGGGTLFPANSLHNDLIDKNIINKYALTADDLWLKIMSLRKGTKVMSIAGEYPRFFIPIIQKNNIKLMDSNIGEGNNDKVFKNLVEFFKISVSIFEEE